MSSNLPPEEMTARTSTVVSLKALEDRVAVLEKQVAHPPLPVALPRLLSDEDARKFREGLEAAGMRRDQYEILPPGPRLLTEDEIRHLLRECVTVVKPGETLIIRTYEWMTPNQVNDLIDYLNYLVDHWSLGFKAVIVPGAELGVAEAQA